MIGNFKVPMFRSKKLTDSAKGVPCMLCKVAYDTVAAAHVPHAAAEGRVAWTRERPTKSGYYWWRNKRTIEAGIVYVYEFEGHLMNSGKGGEWAGPLTPPAAAHGKETR